MHLVAVSTAYVAGTHQGEAREELLDGNRFSVDVDWQDRGRQRPGAARRHRGRVPPARAAGPVRQGGARRARRRRPPPAGRTGRDAPRGLGQKQMVDAWARPGPSPSAGPTPTPTPRPSASGPWSTQSASRAHHHRAAVDHRVGAGRAAARAGSGASAWPSRSSSPTPAACCRSSPACPRASSTSSRSTWWWRPSSPWPRAGPTPAPGRPCTTWPRACGTRCATASWSTWSQDWFTEHPLYDSDGQPIVVPEWSFPGRGRVQRQLHRAPRPWTWPRRCSARCRSGASRPRGRPRWRSSTRLAERALGYVELYGAYTETEARYRVDRLLALWDRCDADDRERFGFDPAVIDWEHYVRDIHLPSVVEHARVRTTPGKSSKPNRADRASEGHPLARPPPGRLRPREHAHRLQRGRLLRLAGHPPPGRRPSGRPSWPTWCAEAPSLLALDRRDRGDFLRSFYRRYEGAPVDRLRDDAWELFHHLLLTKSFPAGFARVREHRALGHRTLLITGALDFVVEPLRPLFDDIVCARLGDGATAASPAGSTSCPPIGEARALVLADYAERARALSSRSRWPTPTRPATCPCSRRSASRWRSTPRPSWPPSPGAGAGTSSTGTRPRAAPDRRCRSARRPRVSRGDAPEPADGTAGRPGRRAARR